MKFSNTLLISSLTILATLIPATVFAAHTPGFLKLEREQAFHYHQCQPQNYDHWFKLESGQNLSEALPAIIESLPVSPAIPPDAAAQSSTGKASTAVSRSPKTTPDQSSKRFTPSKQLINSISDEFPFYTSDLFQPSSLPLSGRKQQNEPPLAPEHPMASPPKNASLPREPKVLIMLEVSVGPYRMLKEVNQTNIVIGLCIQPPAAIPDILPISTNRQGLVLISDMLFKAPPFSGVEFRPSDQATQVGSSSFTLIFH